MPLGKGPLSEIRRVGHAGRSSIGKKRPKLIREKDRRIEEEKREVAAEDMFKSLSALIFNAPNPDNDLDVIDVLREAYLQGRADLLAETLAGM